MKGFSLKCQHDKITELAVYYIFALLICSSYKLFESYNPVLSVVTQLHSVNI